MDSISFNTHFLLPAISSWAISPHPIEPLVRGTPEPVRQSSNQKFCGILSFWSFLSFAEHNGSRFSWHCCRDMDIPYAGP
jgi:hypothetical protein